MRGTTTVPGSGSVRLFAVPSSVILHPSLYATEAHVIYDHTTSGGREVAIRKYNTPSVQSPHPILFSEPFNYSDPPAPPQGQHYCLIAECKPDGLNNHGVPYKWPHHEIKEFSTTAEYVAWLRFTPHLCQRNICYIHNHDAPCHVCCTSFTIPREYTLSISNLCASYIT